MKLYYTPGACSLAVHITLREMQQSFNLVKVDLATHTTEDGKDYRHISPRGYVPLLELDDGSRHSEAAALLQYLADQDPKQSLIGEPGSLRRLHVTKWLSFVSTELHKSFSPWLWRKDTAESTRQTVMDKLHHYLEEIDQHLREQPYLTGDFSIADVYAFTVINWANFLNISLAAYPRVLSFMERVASRPAAQEALKAEGLLR